MSLLLRLGAVAAFAVLSATSFAQNKWFVNDGATNGDVYTFAVGDDANAGTANAPFLTINQALSIAAAGDSVFVDAGIYVEMVDIIRTVYLCGAKKGIPAGPVDNPVNRGTNESIIQGSIIFGPSINNTTIDGFYINKSNLQFGIQARGLNTRIINNMITGTINMFSQQCGIATRANAPWRLHSYQISNNHITNTRFGIYFDGNMDAPSTISYNYVGYCGQTGYVLTGSSGHHWKGNTAEFTPQGMLVSYGGILIEQNTFRNNPLAGIRLSANNPSLLQNNGIVNNFIQNNGVGINLTDDDPNATGNYAHYNHFSGNLLNIQSVITPDFNASCNWFGSADLGTIATTVTGNILYQPFLSNGVDIDPVEIGFQTDLSCIVVPVKLTNFTVQKVNADVRVKWNTENEINNSHFEIQRSRDGVNFEYVGSVNGNGNSTVLLSYEFIDRNAMQLSDLWFYRLKQVDTDERFTFSSVAVVKGSTIQPYSVFPNPSRNQFQIRINDNATEGLRYRLFTASGTIVKRGLITGNIETVNTYGLSNGIYILEIYDRSGGTKKVRVAVVK